MPLTPGTRLGRYEVIRLLGAGGMGEVYLAKDERLEREVALKVLPTGTLADESARKRFRREALALSKLNHPNIETVHDFDTHEGVDFLVMEYVAGETLDENLAAGALPEKMIVSLGTQLVEGLAAAHAQGVIHRDLKPGNLRVTPDRRLKILDFGLAKLLQPVSEGSQAETVSRTQAAVGTPPYMAPEQLRGEQVDARTDIFALGGVLYEMATGQRAFQEETSPRLTDAILHQAPVTPRAVNARVSPDLERIILKCLEKDPERRYQSAKEICVDLRQLGTPSGEAAVSPAISPGSKWPAMGVMSALGGAAVLVLLIGLNVGGLRERLFGGASASRIESLAVLPLENLSGDPEQDYFADGMTDALITDLSKISALKVISRTSSMRYKSKNRPPLPEIARQLGVDALIEGSVLRVGNRVRITAQLIEAATDQHLWAENYERDFVDILTLQGEVARAIAEEIKISLTPQEMGRLQVTRQIDPEAHELYLRGRYQWEKRTNEEGFRQASQFFERAIEKDPAYSPAYSGLADVYVLQPTWGFAPPWEALPRARAAALKALELDEGLAEPYATLGFIKWTYDRDWSGAERDYRRALELNPNYATAHHWYGLLLSALGKHREAIAEIESAARLDPLSPIISNNLGRVLYHARRYDQAVHQFRKTVEMHPEFYLAFLELGMAYSQMGRHPNALAAVEKGKLLPEVTPYSGFIGWIYARSGRKDEAERLLRRLHELSTQHYIDPGTIAIIYTGLGRTEEALTWLARAYEARGAFLIVSLKVNPVWDPLRSDPRFQDLLRRMGFPE